MEFHRGRLIDHIQLRCADLARSRRFYEAVLRSLGRELIEIAPGLLVADELCLSPSDGSTSRIHIAFQVWKTVSRCKECTKPASRAEDATTASRVSDTIIQATMPPSSSTPT